MSHQRNAPETESPTRWQLLGSGRVRTSWRTVLMLFAVYTVTAAGLYVATGLGEWNPTWQPWRRTISLAALYLLFPGLVEELVWRWGLISPAVLGERRHEIRAVVVTSLLAVAMHPLVALTVAPHTQPVFLHGGFLLIVLLLNLTCGAAYVVSRSVWPAVAIHWLTIVAWKFLFAGPLLFFGR